MVLLLTGSQGEPRAALARVAEDTHRHIAFSPGDMVVFSSRSIPGNEVAINRIINALVSRGVRVLHDGERLVHVSGHPRRNEMRALYGWLKPKIAIPVHGEAMHLAAHAELARNLGVDTVLTIGNGTMVRLAPEPAGKIETVEAGRIYKDGMVVGDLDAVGVPERRRLSFSGHVAVSVVMTAKGEIEADPEVGALRPAAPGRDRPADGGDGDGRRHRYARIHPAPAPARSGNGARGGAPRCARRRRRGLGQEARLFRPGVGRLG